MIVGWLLTIHEIGRAGQPDATKVTLHGDHQQATKALYQRFGERNIRGGASHGTAGGVNGKVFQASHVWSIQQVEEKK